MNSIRRFWNCFHRCFPICQKKPQDKLEPEEIQVDLKEPSENVTDAVCQQPQKSVDINVQQKEQKEQSKDEPLETQPGEVSGNTETDKKPNDSPLGKNCFSAIRKVIHHRRERAECRRRFKAQLEAAIEKKNIFWLQYNNPDLLRGLLRRGWMEKSSPTFNAGSSDTMFLDESGTYKHELKVWYNVQPNIIWGLRSMGMTSLKKDQMINNFKETRSFTTKIGLCKSLSELHWYADEDPHTFFPRCYYLVDEEDRQAFTDDFRMTAARNILKWVLRNNGKTLQGEDVIPSQREKEGNTAMCRSVANRRDHGDAVTVTEDVIVAALLACKMHLDILENKDIDNDLEPVSAAVAANWETFLCSYYQVIHHSAHIQNSEKYVEHCRSVLRKLEPVTPQLDIDGERNIWIIKPGAKARGQDIHCNDCLEDILDLVESNPALTMNMLWVAQKYIERPLLVHGTKVDLRQHFLITDWNPLTIWFYKDSFLRFSTRLFTLESLDTSIHLCNNSVQRNLSIARNCHPDVPGDKMWHSDRFKEYLRTIGKEHVWDSVIIPGMKKALIHAMQVSQGQSDYRKNSFDIFGADFMFGEDFQPWLLEINLKPDLFKYTAAMEKLVPFMYEDLLRVLIDHKNDPNCDVGAFELIYKKEEIAKPKHTRKGLLVKGCSIKKPAG